MENYNSLNGSIIRNKTALLICVMLLIVPCVAFQSYTKSIMLGTQVKLSFETYTSSGVEYVRFLVEKSAGGYVAFGIGSSMSDADIVVIERTGNGVTLNDCKLTGQMQPICSETEQAWTFYDSQSNSAETTSTSMKVEIKRTRATSGVDSDKTISAETNTFIYSYTTSDTLNKHDSSGAKGTIFFNLRTGATGSSDSFLLIQLQSVFLMFSVMMVYIMI